MAYSTNVGAINYGSLGRRQRTAPGLRDIYSSGGTGPYNSSGTVQLDQPFKTPTYSDGGYGAYGFSSASRRAPSMTAPGVPSDPSSQYSLLSKVKNPAIARANSSNMSAVGSANGQNDSDFSSYMRHFADQQSKNQGYLNQESGAVNSYFNGQASDELGRMRKTYTDNASNEIEGAVNSLDSQRKNYFDTSKNQIDNFSSTLAGQLGRYQKNTSDAIGKSEGDLADQRSNYEGRAQGSIDQSVQDLASQRNAYESKANADISDTDNRLAATRSKYAATAESETASAEAALAAQREKYRASETGSIAKEIGDRKKLASDYQTAAQQATEISIADADRVRKSQEMVGGSTGGSSYFARMAIGDRVRANSDLQTKLANVNREDYGITRAEQAGLGSRLYGDERSDTGLIHGERARVNEDVSNRERSDVGMVLGQRSRLDEDVANRARSDYGYTRGRQDKLIEDVSNRQRADYGYTQGKRDQLNETVASRERDNASVDNASRTRLNDTVSDRERSDFGMTHGERLRLSEDAANRERSDYGFVRDSQTRLLGSRSRAGDQQSQNYLLPISARNAMTSSRLDNLGRTQAIDERNTYYGLDDGGPSRAPQYNVSGGGYGGGSYSRPYRGGGGDQYQPENLGRRDAVPQGQGGIPSRRSAADEAYKAKRGVYPNEDRNYSQADMDTARSAASGPAPRRFANQNVGGSESGFSRTADGQYNLSNNFDYGSEWTRVNAPDMYVPGWDPEKTAVDQMYYE